MTPDSFSGQVWSLTYDVINKQSHGHKISQPCNIANERQSCPGRSNFQKDTKVLTFWKKHFFSCRSSRAKPARDLLHCIYIRLGGNIETDHFATELWYNLNPDTYHQPSCFYTLLSCFHSLFSHIWLCYVTDDDAGVLLGHQHFSSIAFEHIEMPWEEHGYDRNETPTRLICNVTSLVQLLPDKVWLDLDLRVTLYFVLNRARKYIILRGSYGWRFCLTCCLITWCVVSECLHCGPYERSYAPFPNTKNPTFGSSAWPLR